MSSKTIDPFDFEKKQFSQKTTDKVKQLHQLLDKNKEQKINLQDYFAVVGVNDSEFLGQFDLSNQAKLSLSDFNQGFVDGVTGTEENFGKFLDRTIVTVTKAQTAQKAEEEKKKKKKEEDMKKSERRREKNGRRRRR